MSKSLNGNDLLQRGQDWTTWFEIGRLLQRGEEFPEVKVEFQCLGSTMQPCGTNFCFCSSIHRAWLENCIDKLGFASLTVWNMRTGKAMTVLPLGKDPRATTSLCFNHNGKILAASATNGMIHIFDMSAGLQITGWPAHDSAISSIVFCPDETSIFSLGSNRKVQGHMDGLRTLHTLQL